MRSQNNGGGAKMNTIEKGATASPAVTPIVMDNAKIVNNSDNSNFSAEQFDILSSLEEVRMKPAKGDDLEICFADQIEEPKAMMSIAGVLLASMQNISVIGGKQKSRKTFFICMCICAFLTGGYGTITGCSTGNGKVLLFDTEQGKAHVWKVVNRVHHMAEATEGLKNFHTYYLREKSIDERIEIIQDQIEKHRPALVVIDGIVDACHDFNNIDASTATTQLLMELSAKYGCHIMTVLHENKGDGNLRGHLGSILTQKAETVIQLQKDGDFTKVSAAYTRNLPFDDFVFTVNSEGLPIIMGCDVITKKTPTDIMVNVMRQVLDGKSMTYGALKRAYMELAGKSERTATGHISKCSQLDIIYRDAEDEKYRAKQWRS